MRPPLVTPDEIVEAGRQIRARGEEVTGWAIRRQVGDRGQARRLEAIWRELGDSAPPAPQDDEAASNLPTPLQELVNEGKGALTSQLDTIVAAIHRHARADADATYQRVTEALQSEMLHYRRELDLAEASVTATEAEAQRQAETVAALESEVTAIRIDLANAVERERHNLARADDANAQMARLRSELEVSNRTAQASAEARAAAEAQTATMRDEVDHLRAALRRAETTQHAERAKAGEDLASAWQDLDATRQQAVEAQTTARALRADQERAAAELATERAERHQAEANLQAAQLATVKADQRIAVLTAELAEVTRGRELAEGRAAEFEAERRERDRGLFAKPESQTVALPTGQGAV